MDGLVQFEDGTYGVIDFKTSSVAKTSKIYSRQLHAYAAALENPSKNSQLKRGKVSHLGLVVYEPSEFHTPLDENGKIRGALVGNLQHVKMEHNHEDFVNFLGEVSDVLNLAEAPPAPKSKYGRAVYSCPYCQYLHAARECGLFPGN